MPNLDLTISDVFYGDIPVLMIMKGDVKKWPSGDIAMVVVNVDHATCSIGTSRVALHSSFSETLLPNTGCVMISVSISMGGLDITSTAYDSSDGSITIADVTGNIIISATAIEVITFEDSNVKSICVSNWGGSTVADEITTEEAALVTAFSNKFRSNSTITKFNELQYFTGLTSLGYNGDEGAFLNCTNLTEVTIPEANISNFRGSFRQCSKLESVDLSPTTATTGFSIRAAFLGCSILESITLPGGQYAQENMYRTFFSCKKLTTIDIDGTADWSKITQFQETFNISNSVLSTITGAVTGIKVNISLGACPLTRASALVILNGLDTASGKTVTFKASTYALLTVDDIAIATGKGWSVASV